MSEQMVSNMADSAAQYLTTKPALLDSPGMKLHGLYASASNIQNDIAENTWNWGRLILTLSSTNFGGSSQVVIPNSSFVGYVILNLQLQLTSATNVVLNRGWGYAAIQSINYQMGSSNANQQQITGQSLLQIIHEQAGSEEKFTEMFNLGGQEQLAPSASPTIYEANVLLPFPFSTACGSMQKLPFDTEMLNSPIFLTVNFNTSQYFIGGSGYASAATQFNAAQMIFRQGDLFNKDLSLAGPIKRNPGLIYGYPFIHHQSFTPSPVSLTTGSSIQTSINLLSILNADLVGLSFGVLAASDYQNTTGATINPFNYINLSNVQLLFNGQYMYNAPGTSYKLMQTLPMDGRSYFQNSLVAAGTTAPYTSSPVNTYPVHMDFSRKREACFGQEFANVWRIGNNALSLGFTPTSAGLSNTLCYIFVTYHYNGLIDVVNGETRIIY